MLTGNVYKQQINIIAELPELDSQISFCLENTEMQSGEYEL